MLVLIFPVTVSFLSFSTIGDFSQFGHTPLAKLKETNYFVIDKSVDGGNVVKIITSEGLLNVTINAKMILRIV